MRMPRRTTGEQILLRGLLRRWREADGHEMPRNIQLLSLEVIERAVMKLEAGETVFVAPDDLPVVVTGESGESFLDWDGHE